MVSTLVKHIFQGKLGLSCGSGPGISFTCILKLLLWKGNLHITLHWALKCLRKCCPVVKIQQIFSKISRCPCPLQDHIFTGYLTQICFIPVGKTVISHTYELKTTFNFSPLISQAVFSSVLCVIVYSEVLGLRHPEGLIHADVGAGCIKL